MNKQHNNFPQDMFLREGEEEEEEEVETTNEQS